MKYLYKRADGSYFETEQGMQEPALTVCPESGQACSRVITGGRGVAIPHHMMAPGSKMTHFPDALPTTMKYYRDKVIKEEYR